MNCIANILILCNKKEISIQSFFFEKTLNFISVFCGYSDECNKYVEHELEFTRKCIYLFLVTIVASDIICCVFVDKKIEKVNERSSINCLYTHKYILDLQTNIHTYTNTVKHTYVHIRDTRSKFKYKQLKKTEVEIVIDSLSTTPAYVSIVNKPNSLSMGAGYVRIC